MAMSVLVVRQALSPQDTVLWSVICEAVYYLLYPAILYLRKRANWPLLLAGSVAAAAGAISLNARSLPDFNYGYGVLGVKMTWLVGLPCWILGCWLAEEYRAFPVPSAIKMWALRSGTVGLFVVASVIRFQSHRWYSSNCIVLDMLAFPAFGWLGYQVAYASQHPPLLLLEWIWRLELLLVPHSSAS